MGSSIVRGITSLPLPTLTSARPQLTAASRQIFAFARDKALPFSRTIYRVHPRTQTPVNAVWASALVALLLGLLAFAGPSANSAIFSLAIAGQYTAYSIPILARFLGGRAWTPGPFSLGRFVSGLSPPHPPLLLSLTRSHPPETWVQL